MIRLKKSILLQECLMLVFCIFAIDLWCSEGIHEKYGIWRLFTFWNFKNTWKICSWLLDRFGTYVVRYCSPKKKEIYIVVKDVHLTFALPIGSYNIVEVGNECTNDDFELVLQDLWIYWNLQGVTFAFWNVKLHSTIKNFMIYMWWCSSMIINETMLFVMILKSLSNLEKNFLCN